MTVPVLPETAPFSPAQRGWLNGFLAGLLGMGTPSANGHTPSANGHAKAAPAVVDDESFPWHDPGLPLDERLKLADGKPHERTLMAAMAQLDCGSCGYLCKSYAEAIAAGEETDLTKCSPGGKETAKKLKELVANRKALPAVAANGSPRVDRQSVATALSSAVYDRKNPFPAPLIRCVPLNQSGSAKDVRFVSFNLKGSGLSYEVGDALGVYPENCPDLVEAILATLGARGDELLTFPNGRFVHSYDALIQEFNITQVNDHVVELLASQATDLSEENTLKALVHDDPDGILEGADVFDLLRMFPSARPTVLDLISRLAPLQPRLYSISSSLKAHPDEVHLTVGIVRYSRGERPRKGVASTFMADLLKPRMKAKVFVHPSQGFRLPDNPDTPVIMIGPGTGIAPFRAFLHERDATGARGKNWLFFGDQRRDCDFLYRDEIDGFQERGLLTRLDTAFSRDQERKVYVQHRMQEAAAEIWSWLQEGAHVYVCGDARRMALDVDQALHVIAAEQGNLSEAAAKDFIKELGRDKRYQRDVY